MAFHKAKTSREPSEPSRPSRPSTGWPFFFILMLLCDCCVKPLHFAKGYRRQFLIHLATQPDSAPCSTQHHSDKEVDVTNLVQSPCRSSRVQETSAFCRWKLQTIIVCKCKKYSVQVSFIAACVQRYKKKSNESNRIAACRRPHQHQYGQTDSH